MTVSALGILHEAERKGREALEACNPDPMVVTEEFPTKGKEYFVADGVCGFAWIRVAGNSWFIRELKKIKVAGIEEGAFRKDNYAGGYAYWVREGGQSMQRKEAFAKAFSEVLDQHGIENTWSSRMD